MAYAIIRMQKHKTMAGIAKSAQHTFREHAAPNADATKTRSNQLNGPKDTSSFMDALKARLSLADVKSKQPVLAIEYLVTASPEAFKRNGGHLEDKSDYFKKALEFLEQKHGKNNVIASQLHLDEKTPHLVVYAVPLVHNEAKLIKRSVNQKGGGRKTIEIEQPAHISLNARHFFGDKFALKKLQSDFAFHVGRNYELVRGVEGSRATHKTMAAMYGRAEKALKTIKQTAAQLPGRVDNLLAAVGIKTKTYQASHNLSEAIKQKKIIEKAAQIPSFSQKIANSKLSFEKEQERHLKSVEQLEKDLKQFEENKLKVRNAILNTPQHQLQEQVKRIKAELEKAELEKKALRSNLADSYAENDELRSKLKKEKQQDHGLSM